MIDTIFIFAAGLGTRMKELTINAPKPLLKVAGKPLLEHNLELVLTYPFKKIIINTHYHADKISNFIQEFKSKNLNLPEIIVLHENDLLETGGAVKNATNLLNLEEPIFTLNCDVIIKAQENIFCAMANDWDPTKMDFLLLLQDYKTAVGYKGLGDFDIDASNGLTRLNKQGNHIYEFMYSGLSIIKPNIVSKDARAKFSLSHYYKSSDKAYGYISKGSKWYHASSPCNLQEIESSLS